MRPSRRFEKQGVLSIASSAWGGMFFAYEAPAPFEREGDAAVVTITGPLSQHDEGWWDSYDAILARCEAALGSDAKALVLRIDSPGGDAAGNIEAARTLRAMADGIGKPVFAFVEYAASAAYALAAVAEQIVVLPSALVGSVGSLCILSDWSESNTKSGLNVQLVTSGKRKGDGNPNTPITPDMRAAFQTMVDQSADLFIGFVAERRGLAPEVVRGFEAGTFMGQAAVASGLANRTGSFEDVLAMVASKGATRADDESRKAMTWDEIIAALKELASGDDEHAADAAKALAALGLGDAEGEVDNAADPPAGGDDDTNNAAMAVLLKSIVDTAVAPIASRLDKLEVGNKATEATQRAALIASRADLAPAMVAELKKLPLSSVRAILAATPKPATPKLPAAASPAVAAVQGNTQTGTGVAAPSPRAQEMASKMGMTPGKTGVRLVGTKQQFGVRLPATSTPPALPAAAGAVSK